MFKSTSPTFSKLKCPRLETCPFTDKTCIFSHDPSVYIKGGTDGRIGLSSMTYFKDLQQRMRSEEAACKESNLFSTTEAEESNKLTKAMESDLSNFLHRSPAGYKISASLREKVLLKLIKAMRVSDAGSSLGQAAEIEFDLLKRSGGTVSSVYLSAVGEYVKRITEVEPKKREISDDLTADDEEKEEVTYEDLKGILANKASLGEYNYPELAENESECSVFVACSSEMKPCRRCGINFVPFDHYKEIKADDEEEEINKSVCRYHSEKPERIGGLRVYGCCHAPVGDSNGCTSKSRHVFEGFDYKSRGGGEVKLNPKFPSLPESANPKMAAAVALDAEMSYTIGGYEVSRLTAVDFFTEKTLMDVLIKPRCGPVLDYNTKWSGVSAESFESGEYPVLGFDEARDRLAAIIGVETILIGHSLDNDLRVLEFSHQLIVDTAILYPHRARPPYRMSLKALALGHLSELVQQSLSGHDSKEDCTTCIRLVKKYFKGTRNK